MIDTMGLNKRRFPKPGKAGLHQNKGTECKAEIRLEQFNGPTHQCHEANSLSNREVWYQNKTYPETDFGRRI